MRGDYQSGKFLVRGKDVYIWTDVHKEKWHVTARVEGEELFHGSMQKVIGSVQGLQNQGSI
jgi:hypothetical protein